MRLYPAGLDTADAERYLVRNPIHYVVDGQLEGSSRLVVQIPLWDDDLVRRRQDLGRVSSESKRCLSYFVPAIEEEPVSAWGLFADTINAGSGGAEFAELPDIAFDGTHVSMSILRTWSTRLCKN